MPKAEATGLAPKQSADRHGPLAPLSEGRVSAHARIPPCRASSWEAVSASMTPSAHPESMTLRWGTAFAFLQLTAAGVFAERIALVKFPS